MATIALSVYVVCCIWCCLWTPILGQYVGSTPSDVAQSCLLTHDLDPIVLCNLNTRLPTWSNDAHETLYATLHQVYEHSGRRVHVVILDSMRLDSATPRYFAEQVLKLLSPDYSQDALVLISTMPPL